MSKKRSHREPTHGYPLDILLNSRFTPRNISIERIHEDFVHDGLHDVVHVHSPALGIYGTAILRTIPTIPIGLYYSIEIDARSGFRSCLDHNQIFHGLGLISCRFELDHIKNVFVFGTSTYSLFRDVFTQILLVVGLNAQIQSHEEEEFPDFSGLSLKDDYQTQSRPHTRPRFETLDHYTLDSLLHSELPTSATSSSSNSNLHNYIRGDPFEDQQLNSHQNEIDLYNSWKHSNPMMGEFMTYANWYNNPNVIHARNIRNEFRMQRGEPPQ
jgi:hypothetical protein